VVGY